MRPRIKRLSQRAIANAMEFMGGGVEMLPPRKAGPQKEGAVNKEIAKWRALKPGLVLERNKRRVAMLPNGQNVMFGWLCEGSADWIGYRSLTITPDMVGKTVAQFVAIEAKSETGRIGEHQQAFLDEVTKAGGVAGVARSFEDCEAIWQRK